MLTSGQSHPFVGKWTVGYDKDGKLLAGDVQLVCNGGSTICCSDVVMDRGIAHFQNAYCFGQALRVVGRIANTNLTGNTAFRGFGVPQSALICEGMMEAIACSLQLSPEAVRAINLMQTGGRTHSGQLVRECQLGRVWSELQISAKVEARRSEVAQYNAAHKWSKRGIAVIPTMYGINFPLKRLNQVSCLTIAHHTDLVVFIQDSGGKSQ